MSNNPTRRPRNLFDRVIDALETGEKNFIQSLKPVATDSSVTLSGLGGGAGSQGGNSGNGQYLPLAGGSMSGPIALGPKTATTSLDGSNRGHLDVSKDKGKFTSNIIIVATPSNWKLSYIDGDYWDGQVLRIHVIETETLTIRSDGNILLPPGTTSFDIKGPVYFEVMFNSTIAPNGNTGGWELTNPTTQVNGCLVATKCYVNGLLAAAGLFVDFIIETLSEFVNIGNGTQEYRDIGFIEPRTDAIDASGVLSLIETVNVGNGTQEYKDIGFISEPITESITNTQSTDAFNIDYLDIGGGMANITFSSLFPNPCQCFDSKTLTYKVDGSTIGSAVAGSDGTFSSTISISSLTPGLHTAKITSAGNNDAITLFTV